MAFREPLRILATRKDCLSQLGKILYILLVDTKGLVQTSIVQQSLLCLQGLSDLWMGYSIFDQNRSIMHVDPDP